jgi:hypothetical protein
MSLANDFEELSQKQRELRMKLRECYPLIKLVGRRIDVYGDQVCFTEDGDYLTWAEARELLIEVGKLFDLELSAKSKGKGKK